MVVSVLVVGVIVFKTKKPLIVLKHNNFFDTNTHITINQQINYLNSAYVFFQFIVICNFYRFFTVAYYAVIF